MLIEAFRSRWSWVKAACLLSCDSLIYPASDVGAEYTVTGQISIYSIFHEQVKRDPDRVCIPGNGDADFSYGDVYHRSLQLANLLHRQGVSKGCRTALMMSNSPSYIMLFLALSRLEAVIVPVNPHYRSLALRHILNDSRSEAFIYDLEFSEAAESALEVLDHCRIRIAVNAVFDESSALHLDSDTAKYGGPFAPQAEDDFIIYYSAGTLEPPRGAVYDHKHFMHNLHGVFDLLHARPGDLVLVTYSMHHYLPQICGLALSVLSGAAVLPLRPEELPEMAESLRERVSSMIVDPDDLPRLLHDEKSRPSSATAFLLTGGAAAEQGLIRAFRHQLSLPVHVAYGMVEAGPVLTLNLDSEREGSIGIPLSGFNVSVLRDGQTLPPGVHGSFAVPAVLTAPRICGRAEGDAETVEDSGMEWFYSSDTGYAELDGYLYFLDRAENRMQVDGFDVYPESIEQILKMLEGIEEAAVVGPASGGSGQITAVCVKNKGSQLSAGDILQYLDGRLPRYQKPGNILFVNQLPRNIAGKVSRQSLRKNTVI